MTKKYGFTEPLETLLQAIDKAIRKLISTGYQLQ
jgi:hypothetical protein